MNRFLLVVPSVICLITGTVFFFLPSTNLSVTARWAGIIGFYAASFMFFMAAMRGMGAGARLEQLEGDAERVGAAIESRSGKIDFKRRGQRFKTRVDGNWKRMGTVLSGFEAESNRAAAQRGRAEEILR